MSHYVRQDIGAIFSNPSIGIALLGIIRAHATIAKR